MSDPPRLLHDESNPFYATLLRAGVDDPPSEAALRRTLTAVGTGVVVASSTTAAAAGGGTAAAMVVTAAKWIGMGALGGVVTMTAAAKLGAPIASPGDHSARALAQIATPSSRAKPPGAVERPAISNAPDAVPSPANAAAVPSGTSREKSAAPDARNANGTMVSGELPAVSEPTSAPPSPAVPLAAEVSFVDRGWSAIRNGDYARTISELESYERTFPRSSLLPEVLFLRMEAERRLGHDGVAKAYARRILSANPQGVHAGRAREVLGSN